VNEVNPKCCCCPSRLGLIVRPGDVEAAFCSTRISGRPTGIPKYPFCCLEPVSVGCAVVEVCFVRPSDDEDDECKDCCEPFGLIARLARAAVVLSRAIAAMDNLL